MKNWTIRKRILVGGGVLCALIAVMGGVASYYLKKIRTDAHYLRTDVMPGTITSAGFRIGTADNFIRTLRYAQAPTPEERIKRKADLDASSAEISKLFTAYEATVTSEEDRVLFGKLTALRESYRKTRTDYLKLIDAGKTAEAEQFFNNTLVPAFETYVVRSQTLFEYNARNGHELSLHTDALASQASQVILWASVGALGFAGIFGFIVIRSTNRALGTITAQIRLGADQTASAASQVATASQTLADGSSEQAASLEETSASLEEISSMTKRNADSAMHAKDLATQTRHAAEAGASSMEEMRRAMDAIKSSSSNIAKIVKTIDEIAFQTNILALNAAVEAARAGEAGAGFAVVAEEVRSLAQRSAQSAKETAERIDESVTRSEHGVAISLKVAEGFEEIVTKARKVDELVAEIATASREQTQGIGQVTTAVTQMDQVTQTNAASAEESASASEELSSQADMMREVVRELQLLVAGKDTQATEISDESETEISAPKASETTANQAAPAPIATAAATRAPTVQLRKPAAPREREQAPVLAGASISADDEQDRFFT